MNTRFYNAGNTVASLSFDAIYNTTEFAKNTAVGTKDAACSFKAGFAEGWAKKKAEREAAKAAPAAPVASVIVTQ